MSTFMRRFRSIIALFIFACCLVMPVSNVAACSLGESIAGVPTWYKYFDGEMDPSGRCSVVLPTVRDDEGRDVTDWSKSIGYVSIAITEILLRIAALVAVGYIIYGGYRYILSQGDPESAKSARQTIINALIGLVIAVASASIVHFVAHRLTAPDPGQGSILNVSSTEGVV